MSDDAFDAPSRRDASEPAKSWSAAAWLRAFRRVSTSAPRAPFEFSFRPADQDDPPCIDKPESPAAPPELRTFEITPQPPSDAGAGDRMLAILNAMLALQDGDDEAAPGEDAVAEPVELAPLITSVCDAFATPRAPRAVRLPAEMDVEALGACRADPMRLRQLLLTLVSEASKLRGEAAIVLQPSWRGDRLQLDICGLPRPTRTSRRFARSRALIQGLGGTLELPTPATPDAPVCVSLPVDRMARPGRAEAPILSPPILLAAEPVVSFSRPDLGLRVLVAEADPATQSAISVLLADMGVEALRADDPDEVLAIWREESCDAVILDLDSEVMLGASLARAIRSAEAVTRWPRTPLIGFTAKTGAAVVADHSAAGIDLHLMRPVSGSALREILGRAVELEISPPAQSIAIG